MNHKVLLALTVAVAALWANGFGGAAAVEAEQVDPADALKDLRTGETTPDERMAARQAELEAIRRTIEVSERRQEALREELQGVEADRAKLGAELIATAQRMRRTEEEIGVVEKRLDQLHANEDGIRRSLRERRAVMADVLMALQRMGRTPPPAILSRPEDALAAIRGSILAGAVLPDIRIEAEALAADLAELTELTERIQSEHEGLRVRYTTLGEEQARIDLLVASKQARRAQMDAALDTEAQKAVQLAGEAQNLQDLVRTLETEVTASAQAAREAEQSRSDETADQAAAARRLSDTSRIAPAIRFVDAKGLLTWPVAGDKKLGFGDPDGLGGESQGVSLATRPGTPVLAPTDGWVVYAGPFRSYGQVLILNAGDGYHIVLAGMERVNAALGQFVLAGEPIASMGATQLASIGEIEHTSAQPILYVEFRKDGTAIDSAPWWASAKDGEVNG